MKRRVRRWAVVGGLVLAGAIAAGCAAPRASGTAQAAGTSPPRVTAPLSQANEGGNVTVKVTWANPGATGEGPRFEVELDTHSVNLDEYRLEDLAVLRAGGREVKPESWSESGGGGHHQGGILRFPARVDGAPVLRPGIGTVELVIRDIAGVPARVFKWEVRP